MELVTFGGLRALSPEFVANSAVPEESVGSLEFSDIQIGLCRSSVPPSNPSVIYRMMYQPLLRDGSGEHPQYLRHAQY